MQLHIFHPGFPQVGYLELLAPVPGSTRMAGMWDGTFGWDACAVPDRELCTFFVGPLRNEAFTVNLSYSEQPHGGAISCPTCTALADLALVLPDRTTGDVDYIFTCSRCGRAIWRK